MSTLTYTAPKRIWLCISDDEAHYDEPWPERYPEDDAITWSTDQPVACTVAYERSDITENLRQECDRAWRELDAMARERDAAEKERDDAIRTAQDNAAEVEKLKADLEAARALLNEIREWIPYYRWIPDLRERVDAAIGKKTP